MRVFSPPVFVHVRASPPGIHGGLNAAAGEEGGGAEGEEGEGGGFGGCGAGDEDDGVGV